MTRLVRDQLGLSDAKARVSEGGRRGMRVSVTLPAASAASMPAVEPALASYLFEARVSTT